ncbi:MAG: hypothetical protein QM302_06225 [Acidobacteriota bacterium]|nr:hypothetical protein [Acidobacteriota bacterium]
MSQSNEELANELRDLLGQTGMDVVPDVGAGAHHADAQQDENPLETDFFKALNAFRAARARGDVAAMAAAEERLREVVRDELTGEGCSR